MPEPLTPEQRWALIKRAAQPEAPVAWLLEKLGEGAANIKQAVTEPAEFHRRALTNVVEQLQADPVEFAMNWTGGGLGGIIKPSGIGKRAAEATLKTEKTARDRAVIEAAQASKRGFLNESAVPERVYHATDKDFERFSPHLLGEKRKAGTDKLGFWFGETPESTEFYITNPKQGAEFVEGANLIPAYLQMKKPYRMDAEEFYELSKKSTQAGEMRKKTLQEAGYDGIIAETGSGNAYAVFEPTQIKSAIGMQGHYDIKNPEITKAAGGAVGYAAGGIVEFDPDKIDRIAAEFWDEQSSSEKPAAERPRAPMRPEELHLREGAASARFVRAPQGYNVRAGMDVAPGVQPFIEADPWRRLIAQYGVQYAQPLPGGAASAELAFDPATNARILSGAYRQRLSDDSELSARGAYIAGGEKPSYNIGVEYRRRFATGGSVTAYDSGKIQGLADALREEMYA